jgi:hypothetical protein
MSKAIPDFVLAPPGDYSPSSSNNKTFNPDDALSPHNPTEIRQAISDSALNTALAPPAPPQIPGSSTNGSYILGNATPSQEQIMKRDEILRPIFGEVGDLYNGKFWSRYGCYVCLTLHVIVCRFHLCSGKRCLVAWTHVPHV